LAKNKPEVELYLKTNHVDVMLVSETHFTTRTHSGKICIAVVHN
jgi:hypothetical protein